MFWNDADQYYYTPGWILTKCKITKSLIFFLEEISYISEQS